MAPARKPISDRAYLVELEQQIDELRKEATRLNRRLRDARAAVHTCEDGLAALAASVQTRLADTDSSGPSARARNDG
jgi:predicted  nucleic acid-binding Zn-ribbon protein